MPEFQFDPIQTLLPSAQP
uniref:Uncharacterized protein n=1 Tax=Arundo donax TaxID=35708 RepID=A0A0A8YJI5_ARUDO